MIDFFPSFPQKSTDLRFISIDMEYGCKFVYLCFPLASYFIFDLSHCSAWIVLSALPLSTTSMSDADETSQCLPSDEITLIRPLLDEFKSAKRGERKNVVRKGLTAVMAARDISHLQPLAQAKIIARVKEVCKLFEV